MPRISKQDADALYARIFDATYDVVQEKDKGFNEAKMSEFVRFVLNKFDEIECQIDNIKGLLKDE